MSTHQSSNIATYADASGAPIYTVYFAEFDARGGMALVGYSDWLEREEALQSATERGRACKAVSHAEAFQRARRGEPLHLNYGLGDWRPLFLNERSMGRLAEIA